MTVQVHCMSTNVEQYTPCIYKVTSTLPTSNPPRGGRGPPPATLGHGLAGTPSAQATKLKWRASRRAPRESLRKGRVRKYRGSKDQQPRAPRASARQHTSTTHDRRGGAQGQLACGRSGAPKYTVAVSTALAWRWSRAAAPSNSSERSGEHPSALRARHRVGNGSV